MPRLSALLLLLLACDAESTADPDDAQSHAARDSATADMGEDLGPAPDSGPPARETAWIGHEFGEYALEPFQETLPCTQWTLENDQAIYVETVELETGGAFHHSNWYVVPEDRFPGPDGFFRCDDRGFEEVAAALAGTVLFAQSTQARYEAQTLGEGVVIKIPPRHKIMSATHLLNASAQPVSTSLTMGLSLLHPRDVKTLVAPLRMSYTALDIPPRSEAHFTTSCDLRKAVERVTDAPFAMKLYWALPHYHGLGNYYALQIWGGPRDGEMLHRLQDFDAEGNGKAFTPPIDISDADGLTVTCGYLNPRRRRVTYGIGEREMCDTLIFTDTPVVIDGSVLANNREVDQQDGIRFFEGPCHVTPLPRSDAQTLPSEDELSSAIYVPPFDAIDRLQPGPTPCRDTPLDAVPSVPATAESVADLFRASCTYSACHATSAPAAGLDLTDLTGVAEHIVPGDAEASPLYQRISRCEPAGGPKMPLNSPTLLDAGRVAAVRDWINSQ